MPRPTTSLPDRMRAAMLRESRDWIDEFCAEPGMSRTTRIKQRAHLMELAEWLVHPETRHPREDSPCSIEYATPAQAHMFLAYLLDGSRYAGPPHAAHRPLAASSRKGFLATLRSFYRYLLLLRVVAHDPTIGIRSPKVRTKPGFHLTPEELRRLLRVPGTPRERIQTYLLVYTAARTIELRRLRWQDIDMHQRTIRLNGKDDRTHIIGIHPALMVELRRWHIHQEHAASRNEHMARALANPDSAFVLLTSRGKQVTHSAIYKQLKRRANHAELHVLDPAHGEHRSRVSPHAIRRSIATMLLNEGHPLDAVADMLNHRQVDTTRTHYAFATPARRRATIDAIDL
jgi:site-specific recombinase XerD